MSLLAQRPRLTFPPVQRIFTRGVRVRHSIGDEVGKWLSGPGLDFKEPTYGTNWLGKTHPFPMNPTFKPPPPISNATKESIFERYMSDPGKYNIRVLAGAYGISVKRVDAILRLKGMEKDWIRGKKLQTGFLYGIEKILRPSDLTIGRVNAMREDVTNADMQDQEEVDDRARDRYQRMYWEPVADSEEPIVPRELERSKLKAKAARRDSLYWKSDIELLTGRGERGVRTTLDREKPVVARTGPERPAIVFKDVRGRFLSVEDRRRRMHEGERRKQVKEKARRARKSYSR